MTEFDSRAIHAEDPRLDTRRRRQDFLVGFLLGIASYVVFWEGATTLLLTLTGNADPALISPLYELAWRAVDFVWWVGPLFIAGITLRRRPFVAAGILTVTTSLFVVELLGAGAASR